MKARIAQYVTKFVGYVGGPTLNVDEANRIAALIIGLLTFAIDVALHAYRDKQSQ